MPSTEQIIQYMNYLFIGNVVFYAFIGFIRGTYKSLYYLITTVLIFFGGWLAMGPVINWARGYDLSSYNLAFNGVPLLNINQFVEEMVITQFPQAETLMTTDTLLKEFVFSLVTMVLQLVYLIVLAILAFTVFKVFFDIIWFIIKPSKKVIDGKKVKRKKGLLSRLGGMGIGAVKGALYSLLFFLPLAGISSVTNSIRQTVEEPQDMKYELVFVNNTMTLVESGNNEFFSDEVEEILDMLGAYDKSIAGKVLGTYSIDEKIFDEILSVKVRKANIKFRKELEIVAQAVAKINKETNGQPFEQGIKTLLKDNPDLFKEIVDDLSKLETIKVAIPIGVEVILLLEDEEGQKLIDKLPDNIDIDLEDFYDIDYQADFKRIGYAFVDVASLVNLENPIGSLDYLQLDPEVVENIFNNIGSMEIVDKFAPLVVSYLVTTDAIENSLADLNLTINDLGFDEVEDWGNEISNIGKIYKAFSELQIRNFKDPSGVQYVTEENINKFSEAVFNSVIIQKAIPVLVNTLSNEFLPEQYQQIITIDTSIFDKEEFAALMNATVVIIKANILGGNEETFFNLSDDLIDDLSKYLSNSEFITSNLSGIINIMLKDINFLGSEIELETLEKSQWTEIELNSIFKTVKVIGNAGTNNLKDLTQENIDSLATNMTNSLFIKKNLNNICESFLGDSDLLPEGVQLQILEDEEWTKTEVVSILSAVQLINNVGPDQLVNLTDNQIEDLSYYLANSKLITRNIDTILEKAIEDLDFGEDVEIGSFENWDDSEAAENELKAVFKSARIISEKGSNTDALLNLSDDEMDVLLSSEIITETLVNVLEIYSAEGRKLDFLVGIDNENIKWYDENYQETEFVIVDGVLIITPVPKATKYNIYVNDNKLTSTRSLRYDISSVEETNPTYKVIAFTEGELRKLFVAINAVTDSIDAGFSVDILSTLTDEEVENIMISDILALSIVNQLELLNDDPESIITIPEGPLTSTDEEIKLGAWKNDYLLDSEGNLTYDENGKLQYQKGELERSLKALQILLDGESIENIDIRNLLDEQNQDIVLESLVVEETIITQIEKYDRDPESIIVIPNNIRANRDLWKGKQGELRKLINSLNYILGDEASLENLEFNLSEILANKDEILKSDVIVEIAITKIQEQEQVHIPSGNGYGLNDEYNRDAWKNKYQLDNEGNYVYENEKLVVLEYGELSRLLEALDLILVEDPETGNKDFDNIDFNFDALFDSANQEIILSSLVVSETAVHEIFEISRTNNSIYIPLGYVNDLYDSTDYNRDKWFNKVDNDKVVKGELAHLLDAADLILDDGSNFNNISFDLNVAFDEYKQEILLKSYVISESIVQKIYQEANNNGVIVIPSHLYVNDVNSLNRDKWFNEYNDEVLVAKHEIANLLNAAKLIIGEDASFENIDFDLKVAFDDIKQEQILKSYVISETIVHKIHNETINGALSMPSVNYVNDIDDPERDKWYNTYQDGTLIKGEIANLLEAAELILGEDASFENINFDLKVAFDDAKQETILKSYVISETIVHKIYEETLTGALKMPSVNYVNDIDDPNRDKWYNTYQNGTLVKGEIANLLEASELILDSDSTFENINFDLSVAFNEIKQEIILKSYVISETIVQKIFDEAELNHVLEIPSTRYVNVSYDPNRDKWYNTYQDGTLVKGEIAHLLDAANIITNGGDFSNIDFEIDYLFDKDKQIVVLKSYVFSETIVQKILANTNAIHSVPEIDLEGRNLIDHDNRDAWYNQYENEILVAENELAKFLDGICVLLGDLSYNDLDNINIDEILRLELTLEYDEQFELIESDFETIVNSVVLENIIAPLAETIATTVLQDSLVVPPEGYHWYKKDLIFNYDLDTFDKDLYDLQSFLESLYVMSKAGIDYNHINDVNIMTINDDTINEFAKAMVVSRVFKGSIAKTFNNLVRPLYDAAKVTFGEEIIIPFVATITLKDWEDVKFNQNDYDDPISRKEAYDRLIIKIKKLRDLKQ